MRAVEYVGSNVTLMVSSMAKALKFYTQTLGLTLRIRESSHWAQVEAPGLTIGLHPKMKDVNAAPSNVISIGLEVRNFDQAVADLEKKGIVFTIHKDSYVHQAYFHDLDMNSLYLFQRKKR